MDNQRIRIDTRTRTPTATSPTGAWVTNSSVTQWCEAVAISPADAVRRYQCPLDKLVRYEFRFSGRPTITVRDTRFTWMTDGHPNRLKIFWPRSSLVNVDGEGEITMLLVEEDTEETANA